jgi:uncharacterized protein YlxW (UPF0749 family)
VRLRGRQAAVLVVAALAGWVLVAGAVTARGTDLRAGSRGDLGSLIAAAERRGDLTQAQVDGLRRDVDTLTAGASAGDAARVRQESDALAPLAGAAPITGPGVRVTLDDADPDAAARTDGLGPDDLVVHQQDVQAVVNAMWRGGADGVSVMDQRLLSTTALRCVGNTLILGGRVYSPPFTITAIGDPDRLGQALDSEPGVQLFRTYVDLAGLGYDQKSLDSVTLPAAVPPALDDARPAP